MKRAPCGHLLCCCALLIAGCSTQPLYTNLGEREANEMLAILMMKSIGATKMPGAENAWNINVATSQFAEALSALDTAGYPKDKFASLGEVFKKSGLVSSPLEERVRFMYAMSETLSETLTHIYGVVTARVHIVLPDNSIYAEKLLPSSASVFISYLPHVNVEEFVKDIKQLVTNSIEGLSYNNVTVVLSPSSTAKERIPFEGAPTASSSREQKTILGLKIAEESIQQFWILCGSFAAILLLCLVAVVFMALKLSRGKTKEE
jgi:type III secretion protein J